MSRSIQGQFLIATPQLNDPNFRRTVVFIAEHNDKGGFGLVLNRPAALRVSKLWEVLSGESVGTTAVAHLGGPVESSAVFLLHSCSDLAGGVEPVVPGVYLGNDTQLFSSLLKREADRVSQGVDTSGAPIYRAFCGYSGWGEGQLDQELESGSWIVQPATPDVVFANDVDPLWSNAMERAGGVYRLLSQMPENPELN